MHRQPAQRVATSQLAEPARSEETAQPRLTVAMPPPAAVCSDLLREQLEAMRFRALGASHLAGTSRHLARLVSRDNVIQVTARLSADDLCFLGVAREELLALAGSGLKLAELHQPLEHGGAGCDPAGAGPRCRNCMWRWPCPTFRVLSEIVHGGSRSA
jgi:hypothetical protein